MAQSKGVAHNILEKLRKEYRLSTVDIITTEPEQLVKITSISYKDILAVRGILLAELSAFPRIGESLLNDARDGIGIFSTGCTCLDDLLSGGVYTGELTEICGPAASGKTQLAINLALHVASDAEQNVLYVDSGGSFDVHRLQQILQHSEKSEQEIESACKRIHRACVFDAFELISLLEEIKLHLCEQKHDFYSCVKLVVIDCITPLLSPFLGAGHSEGYGVLSQIAKLLRPLGVEFSVAIVIINNVVEWDGETRPCLGRAWAGVPGTRLQLARERMVEEIHREGGAVWRGGSGREASRGKAVLVKSGKQRTGATAHFLVTNRGIEASVS